MTITLLFSAKLGGLFSKWSEPLSDFHQIWLLQIMLKVTGPKPFVYKVIAIPTELTCPKVKILCKPSYPYSFWWIYQQLRWDNRYSYKYAKNNL